MHSPSGQKGEVDEEITVLRVYIITQALQEIAGEPPECMGEHIRIEAFRQAQELHGDCHGTGKAEALSEKGDGLITR